MDVLFGNNTTNGNLQAGIIGSALTVVALVGMVVSVYVIMRLCDCGARRWCPVAWVPPPPPNTADRLDPDTFAKILQPLLEQWQFRYDGGNSNKQINTDIELGVLKSAGRLSATTSTDESQEETTNAAAAVDTSTHHDDPTAVVEDTHNNDTAAVEEDTSKEATAAPTTDPPTCIPAEYDNGEDTDTTTACIICMEAYQPGDTLLPSQQCSHVFHASCIGQWLLVQQRLDCPLCATPLIPETEWQQARRGVLLEDDDDDDRAAEEPPSSAPHGSYLDDEGMTEI